MTARPLDLYLLTGRYAVCQLPARAPLPQWAGPLDTEALWAVTRTADEVSVVCAETRVPAGVRAEHGWVAVGMAGPLDFSLTGVLASIADPLRDAGVSLFALSTYDTDYVLVKASDRETAVAALDRAGHRFIR